MVLGGAKSSGRHAKEQAGLPVSPMTLATVIGVVAAIIGVMVWAAQLQPGSSDKARTVAEEPTASETTGDQPEPADGSEDSQTSVPKLSIAWPSDSGGGPGGEPGPADGEGQDGQPAPPAAEPPRAAPPPPAPAPPAPKPAKPAPKKPAPAPPADPSVAGKMLAAVNKERTGAGLKPLTLDSCLTDKVAQPWAAQMKSAGSLTHRELRQVPKLCPGTRMAGENIAMGQRSVDSVMSTWMNSPGHKRNIMNPSYTKLGVGVVGLGSGRPYWVQNFAS